MNYSWVWKTVSDRSGVAVLSARALKNRFVHLNLLLNDRANPSAREHITLTGLHWTCAGLILRDSILETTLTNSLVKYFMDKSFFLLGLLVSTNPSAILDWVTGPEWQCLMKVSSDLKSRSNLIFWSREVCQSYYVLNTSYDWKSCLLRASNYVIAKSCQ